MLSLNKVLSASAILLLLNACGTKSSKKDRDAAPNPETTAGVACTYSVNGKTLEGKTQEECDQLKEEFEKATDSAASVLPTAPSAKESPTAPGESQVTCAFSIDGKLYEGKSQVECDQLKKDLGITVNVPSVASPEPAASSSQSPTSVSNVTCAFDINGQLHEGKSQAECDKLKKDLGFQF
ncbi:MAG TPA: hypothetical protein VE954_22535 [Oligoflexus sp.]|uniref:hypothetical protein n=1 Tax=Oligoflexus sp. TaxID=1971216 RepID=UPI002D427C25|nr:hypothetical protein [Oligoflexus sp.]HYX35887.1 hypothetical protein [Oligoflexus sp.]